MFGNKRYVRYNHGSWALEHVYNPEGYIRYYGPEEHYSFYYIKDHLGNVHETYVYPWSNYKECVQRMQYYPSGLPWNVNQSPSEQPFKYSGKEFVEMHGLDEYDSQARWYYPAIMRTTAMDPLCEKYYSTSPYAWCANNPVNYVDPDGGKVVYNDETGDCESMVDEFCSQSEMFKAVYNQLVESDDIYTFQFGETVDNVDGQFVPSEKGGVISLNRDGAWSSAIPEETFHALQNDNKGKYNDTQLNLEFEAKVFVIMSGLPTGSYYGIYDSYYKSLLKMDINEFTQPQSITEYMKQANIYSTYNKDNAIGNKNYWTPTTISPYNLISIIGKLK